MQIISRLGVSHQAHFSRSPNVAFSHLPSQTSHTPLLAVIVVIVVFASLFFPSSAKVDCIVEISMSNDSRARSRSLLSDDLKASLRPAPPPKIPANMNST